MQQLLVEESGGVESLKVTMSLLSVIRQGRSSVVTVGTVEHVTVAGANVHTKPVVEEVAV